MARDKDKKRMNMISTKEKEVRKYSNKKVVVITITMAILCVFLINSYLNHRYSSYKVVHEIERAETADAKYMSFNNSLLKYSREGVSLIDSNGEVQWNGSYSMSNPKADVSGQYVAIADIGGTEVYVFDGGDSGKKVNVNATIVDVEVSKQAGIIAVLQEGTDYNVIDIIDPYNEVKPVKATIKTYVKNSGVPVNFSLSEDGLKLVTNYVMVSDGTLQNNVTFYNFSEVGQTFESNMAGMVNFEDKVISKVEFISNNYLAIYGTNFVTMYSYKERKEELYTLNFEQEIKSICYNEEYLVFVVGDFTEEKQYQVLVYDKEGKKKLSKKVDYEYDTVNLYGKELVFYTQLQCNILKLNGNEKFSYTFNQIIDGVFPINNYDTYFLINGTAIDIVKLTEG